MRTKVLCIPEMECYVVIKGNEEGQIHTGLERFPRYIANWKKNQSAVYYV